MFKKGYKQTKQHKQRIGLANRGKVRSLEEKQRNSAAHSGALNHFWRGGLTRIPGYVAWQKNIRNRSFKRLRSKGLLHSFGEWELLRKQYGFTCPCCGLAEPKIKLTVDHIIPLSRGGTDLIENIQPLCLKCNMRKHTHIIKFQNGTTE